ncbi:MAG TPA: ISL3 family transposase [Ktedonobacteraceae bacterium]|nr:ISL3 family transposase [Ktedonobacteraceae bacterium]
MSQIPFQLPGFEIQLVTHVENTLLVTAVSTRETARCPSCDQESERIHSYYVRSPHDLPSSGQGVRLKLCVRRFRCLNKECQRQTFAERLPEVVAVSAQRTARLTTILTTFVLALNAQEASRLLTHLAMSTSGDTLLRLAKRSRLPVISAPRVVGVDDFALRRGKTYGTIVIDLSTHRPIDLLLGRTAETLSQWLVEHPGVEFISRDRSSEYMRGATEGAPKAQQVLDRYHVLTNMREVVQRIVSRKHAALKQLQKDSGATVRVRYKKKRSSSEIAASQVARLQRQAWYEEVVEHYRQGKSIAAIAVLLQMSPTTVRKFVYAGAFPERSAHKSRRIVRLKPYLSYLEKRVQEGCENASLLWQEIRQQGFAHGYKPVNTWLREYLGKPGRNSSEREQAKRQAFLDAVAANGETPLPEVPAQAEGVPILVEPLESPRHLSWLLLHTPEKLTVPEQQTVTFMCQLQDVKTTYDLAQRFFTMVRERQAEQLDDWLEACFTSNIPDFQTFAEGLKREYSAMQGALTFSYSNGPVEDQINKLKYIKRSMYGRGHFHLLRQKVLQAA